MITHRRTFGLLLGIVVVASRDASAQAARVGRLPLLAMPITARLCTSVPAPPAMRKNGVVTLFNANDSSSRRMLSITVGASGQPMMLFAEMSTREGRRSEGETVSAIFDTRGRVVRGDRRAMTTGTPSRLSEDRRSGLLPGDTVAIQVLADALRRMCHDHAGNY